MIVLDTNVASELMAEAPEERVASWVGAQRGPHVFTTSVTLAEIRYGIERLPAGRRKDLLGAAAEKVIVSFGERVLPFDSRASRDYAQIVSSRETSGSSIDIFAGQIAAICRARGAALATRNTKHFRDTGIELIDPWAATN